MTCQFCSSSWLSLIRFKMSIVYTYEGKILEGWEKARTKEGVPYFVNHATELTQWDHPLLNGAMEKLSEFQTVKYSTYRMALKLRSIQKFLKMHLVTTETLIKIFNQFVIKPLIIQSTMNCAELECLLCDIYNISSLEQTSLTDKKLSAELAANFLVNLFDTNKTGCVKVYSVFVGLLVLSVGKLHEKYKYLFRILANHNNCMSRKNLMFLLHVLAEIPEHLKEKATFGKSFVEPAAESCFSNHPGPLGITEETFLSWVLKEPQSLVWLSTFFRLTTAESVRHRVKCCVCDKSIVGLRYRCLYCFNYDLCQYCFFTGQTSKSHKEKHPIQEYCTEATAKEDRKVLMKRISNKLKVKKHKQSYLPLSPTLPENGVFENSHAVNREKPMESKVLQTDVIPGEEFLNCTIVNGVPMQAFLASQQNELESVIVHLEQQHKILHSELGNLQDISPTSSSSEDGQSTSSRQSELNRQEVLMDHDKQLELQLRRLKRILKSFKKMCKRSDITVETSSTNKFPASNEPITSSNGGHITPLARTFPAGVQFTSTPTFTAAEIHTPPKVINENGNQSTATNAISNGKIASSNEIRFEHRNRDTGIKEQIDGRKVWSPVVTSNFIFPTQSESYCEMNAIQAELESIMAHLAASFPPDTSKSGHDMKNDKDQLLKAAADVGNILSDFVDKVHMPNSKLNHAFPQRLN